MTTKLRLPLILMAHDLKSGKVLYWTVSGWSAVVDAPIIAHNDGDIAQLNQILARDSAANKIVDASLEEVIVGDDGKIKFRHFREQIKQNGPTIKYGAYNV